MSNIPTHLEERIRKVNDILNECIKNDADKYWMAITFESDRVGGSSMYIRNDIVKDVIQQAARFGVKIAREEQWIKCSDRMPDHNIAVWGYDTVFKSIICCFDKILNAWEPNYKGFNNLNITHWQPLNIPTKPKE